MLKAPHPVAAIPFPEASNAKRLFTGLHPLAISAQYTGLLRAAENLHRDSGFTLQLDGTAPKTAADDYYVSRRDFEMTIEGIPTANDIVAYAHQNRALLLSGGCFFGAWIPTTVFDITMVVRGLNAALAEAKRQGQTHIYHPASGTAIPVE